MKNIVIKKSLVYGIIFLFMGLGLTSNIGGYHEKNSFKLVNNEITIHPTSMNDYVNAFWKFDEGSGNTAHDSSVHNYDGTINGATWTTGYSDDALDFDGVDDYVTLDTHSEGLGFNKTDDLIFSFYIKTTSNTKGIIYSTSASWGTNPAFNIFCESNGSIGLKIEVTSCGFTLYTDGSYNNGVWYDVEIWYNGFYTYPTAYIKVDGVIDASVTDWVCPFENDEFTKTKMGKRAHNSSNYFDGVIDEFKIIKYPGGNEQNPPIISGPSFGEVGVTYDYSFITNDPELDDIELYIDWGDGSDPQWYGWYESGEEVIKSHSWDENGSYEISSRSQDIWYHSSFSYYNVIIGNIPPFAPNITGPLTGESGVEYEFIFEAEDHEDDDISYFIDWGDGETEWTDYYPSGEEVTVSHTWDLEDDYEIKAKGKDTQNNEGDWSEPYLFRIGDEPPDPPQITGETDGEVGVEYNYTFITNDPENDEIFLWIEWGDGSIEEDGWIGPFSSGEEVIRSHTWEEKGKYTIKAKAKDTFEVEGDYGSLIVDMPLNQQTTYQSLKPLFIKTLNQNLVYSKIVTKILGL